VQELVPVQAQVLVWRQALELVSALAPLALVLEEPQEQPLLS
jgi:hypothetical protein